MESFNPDPKPGRIVLPLVLIGMIATTYTFINRVSTNNNLDIIAEETFEIVRDYKGSHSGEHGDGLVRSEFHQDMFGKRMVEIFSEVKKAFDPAGIMNPDSEPRHEFMGPGKLHVFVLEKSASSIAGPKLLPSSLPSSNIASLKPE